MSSSCTNTQLPLVIAGALSTQQGSRALENKSHMYNNIGIGWWLNSLRIWEEKMVKREHKPPSKLQTSGSQMQTEAVILTKIIERVFSTKASCRVCEPWWGEIESLAGDDIKDATLDIRASVSKVLNRDEDDWDVCINVTTRNYNRCV